MVDAADSYTSHNPNRIEVDGVIKERSMIFDDPAVLLTEYLLTLIKVKQIIEKSNARDIATIKSFIKTDKSISSRVKSILEREIQEIGRNPDLSNNIGEMERLKTHFKDGIKNTKYLVEVVQPRIRTSSIVNNVIDGKENSVEVSKLTDHLRENQNLRYQTEHDVNQIDLSNFIGLSEMSKMAATVSEYLLSIEEKQGSKKVEKSEFEPNGIGEEKKLKEATSESEGEEFVDLRNIEYGNVEEGLGTVVKITKTQEGEQKYPEMIDNEVINQVDEKKNLKNLKEEKYNKNVMADIIVDFKRDQNGKAEKNKQENGTEEGLEIVSKILESVINIGEITPVENYNYTTHSPDNTPNTLTTEERSIG